MNKLQVYHACRVAFLCGDVPWHLVCKALRQGLEFETEIYKEKGDKLLKYKEVPQLTDKEIKKYPQLKELVEWLRGERTEETEREAVRKINEEIQLRWQGEIKDSPLNPPKLD